MKKFCAIFILLLLSCGSINKSEASSTCHSTQGTVAWDGRADDTAALTKAIAEAIDRAGNGGACVQLPVGIGVLCQVELPAAPNGLTIKGAGIGATTINPCSPTTKIFFTSKGNVKYLDIGNLSIISKYDHTAGSYFDLRNVFNIHLHDIRADKGWNFAHIEQSYILNVCQTDIRNFDGVVFTIDGGADFRWCSANNYDDDTPTKQAAAYLLVKSGGGFVLESVDAIHCGNCYVFSPKAGATIEWVFANQTMADTCSGNGWTLNAPAGTTIKGFQGIGLWGASCAQSGLLTTGAGVIDGVSLIGPRLQNNGADGGNFAAGTSINIEGPMVSGNSANKPGTYSGLSFGGSSNHISINGGRVGTMMQYGDTQLRNIVVHPGSGKIFSILGVNLCGYATGGAAFLDASTNASKMVRNNLCFNAND